METSRCCVAWSDLGIGHDSLVWTPGQNRPESTRVTSPSEHDHDGIWIRGSASSRIVGFVSVFLVLSRCYCYSTLLHPPVSTLPPFVASQFFSPRRSDFFSSLLQLPLPPFCWPSRFKRCCSQWPISDGHAVDKSDRSAYNVLCFRNSGWMEKENSVRHGCQGPRYRQLDNPKRKASS